MAVLMDRAQIMELIPHRDPFLLIDEINEMEPGVRCVATKHMTPEEFWFKGHFPGMPVTPGVLLVEMMAQAGAVAMLAVPRNKGKIGMFSGIDKAKFRRQVVPGDTLRLEVSIVKNLGRIGVGEGTAYVGDEVAASAQIKFVLVPPVEQE